MKKLVMLSLADNLIDSIDGEELPEQIQIVSFKNNPVTTVWSFGLVNKGKELRL